MLPYIAEFLGTMILIILGDGVVANVTLNKSGMKGAGSIQITFAWGLAVMLPAFIFGAASGAHFNPALTIALAVDGSCLLYTSNRAGSSSQKKSGPLSRPSGRGHREPHLSFYQDLSG